MPELLNLSISKGEKILANAHFTWDGDTYSALQKTQQAFFAIISINEDLIKDNDDTAYSILILQHTGASLFWDDSDVNLSALKAKYDFCDPDIEIQPSADRGLIAIHPTTIDKLLYLQASRVNIDIENRIVNFDAIKTLDASKLEEIEQRDNKIYGITDWPFNFLINEIPFKYFKSALFALTDRSFLFGRNVYQYDGKIYMTNRAIEHFDFKYLL